MHLLLCLGSAAIPVVVVGDARDQSILRAVLQNTQRDNPGIAANIFLQESSTLDFDDRSVQKLEPME